MTDLKVISKKYNDEDILEVEGDVIASKIQVSNIEALSDKQLDELKVGDIVQKKTGNQKHAYVVSYKGEGVGEGLCLTYADASTVETVSYDRTASGWEFNSKDVTPLGEKGLEVIEWNGERDFTEEELNKLFENKACVMLIDGSEKFYYYVAKTYIEEGLKDVWLIHTLAQDEGLENGSYSVLDIYDSGYGVFFDKYYYSFSDIKGTKLYRHEISFSDTDRDINVQLPLYVISTRATPYTLNGFSVAIGRDGVISISFYDYPSGSVYVPVLTYDSNVNAINTVDGTSFEDISDFADEVEPI